MKEKGSHNWIGSGNLLSFATPTRIGKRLPPVTATEVWKETSDTAFNGRVYGVDVAVAEAPVDTRPAHEIIQEIHNTFYSEVDRLLEHAKITKSEESEKQALLDKVTRLQKLGFTETKEMKEAQGELQRIGFIQMDNAENKRMLADILYFQQKYPQYKFITVESVRKICAKYNLIFSSIENYTGSVPDQNLEHMEKFRIEDTDEAWQHYYQDYSWGSSRRNTSPKIFIHKPEPKKLTDQQLEEERVRLTFNSTSEVIQKAPLEICAPVSDFNTQNMELNNFELTDRVHVPDPVVLQPVIREGRKHYLIVTCWGLEASDELVVNEKMN